MIALNGLYCLAIVGWWIYFLPRMADHLRDLEFWQSPWNMMALALYLLGMCFTLNHYAILLHLEQGLFPHSELPLVSLSRTLIFLGLNVGFLLSIQSKWRFGLIEIILAMIAVIAIRLHLTFLGDYEHLYWQTSLLIVLALLAVGVQAMRVFVAAVHERSAELSDIQWAHVGAFGTFYALSLLSWMLLGWAAGDGLMNHRAVGDSPMQMAVYGVNVLALVVLVILSLPDHWLYRFTYPLRVRRFYRLCRLVRFIDQHNTITPVYPAMPVRIRYIDMALYQNLIYILDNYPFLNEAASDVRAQIRQIETSHLDPEALVRALASIEVGR